MNSMFLQKCYTKYRSRKTMRELERERERERERVNENGRLDPGGWVPVIRNHRPHAGGGTEVQDTFTLFIDNIPEERDHRWLSRTFNKFGVVKDAFIPMKKSKRTGGKFGFVRYGCHVSAAMAVAKMNGVWVDDKRLFVKEACFDQRKEILKPKLPSFTKDRVLGLGQRFNTNNNNRGGGVHSINGDVESVWKRKFTGGSFAQVLRGETSNPRPSQKKEIIIKSNGAGSGWLHRSAVATMNRVVSLKTLQGSFKKVYEQDVQFRAMGGRYVLITFPTSEVRDELIKSQWMERWFIMVKPWQGEPATFERFVWLNCFGMPLNSWNSESFKSIGEIWGTFIMVDDVTLRDMSFAFGRILIATEIDSWIQMEVNIRRLFAR